MARKARAFFKAQRVRLNVWLYRREKDIILRQVVPRFFQRSDEERAKGIRVLCHNFVRMRKIILQSLERAV